ncbi:hypothetical protein ACWD3I_25230 [Streptomyces sp. NPDC002817]|uniref:hypothetical protein n=1 Tax=Streptomyces sp. NPDC088357 TaxID=3154655 RepID=UPI0034239036
MSCFSSLRGALVVRCVCGFSSWPLNVRQIAEGVRDLHARDCLEQRMLPFFCDACGDDPAYCPAFYAPRPLAREAHLVLAAGCLPVDLD